jgi:hypothetical protein
MASSGEKLTDKTSVTFVLVDYFYGNICKVKNLGMNLSVL